MSSALKPGHVISVKGKRYKIRRSTRSGKVFAACPIADHAGRCIHFGARGADVRPGTPKGDAFCARTYPLYLKQRPMSPTANDFARVSWKCAGKKSRR